MRFEWDENKRVSNIQKHGIDFVDVPRMYDWPVFTTLDEYKIDIEERWIGIGFLDFRFVAVVFIEIDDEVIRIISARKATKQERKQYEQYLKDRLGAG